MRWPRLRLSREAAVTATENRSSTGRRIEMTHLSSPASRTQKRQDAVLAAVKAQPGQTIGSLGRATAIFYDRVYSAVKALERKGLVIIRRAGGLYIYPAEAGKRGSANV